MREQRTESQRRPVAERTEAFNMLTWLADGATGVLDELRHNDLGLPKEFWTHAYTARHESLLAARAFLDHLITQVDPKKKQEVERQARQENNIDIQIDSGNF